MMFLDHPLTPEIDQALDHLDPRVREEILATFTAYAQLLKTAARDREVVLNVIDRVGVRLDEVHPHPDCPPEVSRVRVMKAFDQYVDDHMEMARAAGILHDADPEVGTPPGGWDGE